MTEKNNGCVRHCKLSLALVQIGLKDGVTLFVRVQNHMTCRARLDNGTVNTTA